MQGACPFGKQVAIAARLLQVHPYNYKRVHCARSHNATQIGQNKQSMQLQPQQHTKPQMSVNASQLDVQHHSTKSPAAPTGMLDGGWHQCANRLPSIVHSVACWTASTNHCSEFPAALDESLVLGRWTGVALQATQHLHVAKAAAPGWLLAVLMAWTLLLPLHQGTQVPGVAAPR